MASAIIVDAIPKDPKISIPPDLFVSG